MGRRFTDKNSPLRVARCRNGVPARPVTATACWFDASQPRSSRRARSSLATSRLERRRTVDGMCPAGDRHVRYRRDGGQRLPAEAERLQGREVLSRANLAGRIAFEGGRQLRRRDPTTVVRYLNEAVTAVA